MFPKPPIQFPPTGERFRDVLKQVSAINIEALRLRLKVSNELIIDSDCEPWRTEGLRICVFGGPGSGKSYTAALLAEQWLLQGGTIVVFQPRAEYHVLKELRDVLVVGGPFERDLDFIPSSPSSYARAVVEGGASMIFYTEDVEDEEKLVDFTSRFIRSLLKHEEVHRRPVLLILEEAQEYATSRVSGRAVPSWVYARMIKAFKDCFLQGRKLNVSAIAISPRPQEVNFTIRQLANLTLYGKFSPQDIEYIDRECLKPYRDRGLSVEAARLLDLKPGEWLAICGSDAKFLRVTEPRRTRHGAETPKLEYAAPRSEDAERTLNALIEEIREAALREEAERSDLEEARRRIKELEGELEEARKEIERLKAALAVKESLKIEVKPVNLPQIQLPSVIERLDDDSKKVWVLLRQKPGRYKVEIMAALGFGKKRLEKALRTLQNKRLVKAQMRKLYAQEPLI